MTKKWTEEEIQFLRFAYPNKDITTRDICEVLGRNIDTIHKKASEMKLRKYKEVLPNGLKRCRRCKTIFTLEMFPGKKNKHDWCKECHKEYKEEYKKKVKSTEVKSTEVKSTEVKSTEVKKCPRCNELKSILNFNKNKARHDGLEQYCSSCFKAIREENRIKKLKERGW